MLKGCIIYKQLCTLTYICLLTIYLFCNVMYVKENVMHSLLLLVVFYYGFVLVLSWC